jgi:prolyl-tRNA synthetase
MLPLGWKIHKKVAAIIREEMDAIGGQEFLLPAMHPADIWQKSGRWETMGEEMFRFVDRKGADQALGMTHEEVFASLGTEITSYRHLPQIWYQIQTKFRDEPRPKSGLLRVREFAMKDSYSFDIDDEGLDTSFSLHHDAYVQIFNRLGLDAFPVEASSGAMGGSASVEFMVESEAGEDDVARCSSCNYSANVERASASLALIENRSSSGEPESFPTPDVRTIAALAELGHPPEHQIKTLVYVVDGELTLILLRGDHPFLEQKFIDITGVTDLRPATGEEIRSALGASPGSLGAVGVENLPIYADLALQGRTGMSTGANVDDTHYSGVDVQRDIAVNEWVDVRGILEGESCVDCGNPITITRCIESGHIFKLGRRYAEAMGTTVLDSEGKSQTLTMGSYGIGVERAMAAVAETHHDENGLIWPMSIAPYEVAITLLKTDHTDSVDLAEDIYKALTEAGIDVLLDDREERPGVKFADSELIGIPLRVTIGPRGLENGIAEVNDRSTNQKAEISLETVVEEVTNMVNEAKNESF